MCQNYDVALELTQDTLVKAFKGIMDFKEESSFQTWIMKIASNVCIDNLRKAKSPINSKIIYIDEDIETESGEVKIEIPDSSLSPEVMLERKLIQNAILQALNQITIEQRNIVILKDFQGFDYQKISEILNLPLGTVKSRINRGREAIKEKLLKNSELFEKYFVSKNNKEKGGN